MGGKTSKPRTKSQVNTKVSSSSVTSSSLTDDESSTKIELVTADSVSSTDIETMASTSGSEQEEVPFTVEKFHSRSRLMTSQSVPLLEYINDDNDKNHRKKPKLVNTPLSAVTKKISGLGPLDIPVLIPNHTRNLNKVDDVRLPEQEWMDACIDSLRKAIVMQQKSDSTVLATRSAPTSVAKMETMRATSPQLKKEPNSGVRNDRRNSILSSLNCQLDVIPERIEEERDNPDDCQYSEMDLYF